MRGKALLILSVAVGIYLRGFAYAGRSTRDVLCWLEGIDNTGLGTGTGCTGNINSDLLIDLASIFTSTLCRTYTQKTFVVRTPKTHAILWSKKTLLL